MTSTDAPTTDWRIRYEKEIWGDDGIRSRQYIIDYSDWLILVKEMKSNANFYERHGVDYSFEEFLYGGEPVHHLDVGPKNVKCLRVQNGNYIEGYHWRGHCPALILREAEVTSIMAKVDNKKRTEVTADLSPKKHVADPVATKTKGQKEPRPCSCDCGGTTGGGYFVAGHDSKLKSLFLKVDKGEVVKKNLTKKQMAMYVIYEKDRSERIKDIAKEVWG